MKITIHKNPNGDTRTAPKDVTFEEFEQANKMHIEDVQRVLTEFSYMLNKRAWKHDYTKLVHRSLFYQDFKDAINRGTDFTKGEWYQEHIEIERHHLLSRCPEDVNLIDVIEMIVDCVCAGKTRSGEIRDLEISQEILDKALKNTVRLVDEITVVK